MTETDDIIASGNECQRQAGESLARLLRLINDALADMTDEQREVVEQERNNIISAMDEMSVKWFDAVMKAKEPNP